MEKKEKQVQLRPGKFILLCKMEMSFKSLTCAHLRLKMSVCVKMHWDKDTSIFSSGHPTLHLAVSVGTLVQNTFEF